MDNASKALIMAGAILISLALVGLGVYVYSLAGSYGDLAESTMSAAEIEMTNNQLASYEGTRVRGTTVNAFLNKVEVLNAAQTFPADISPAGTSLGSGDIRPNGTYTLEIIDYNGDGYLDRYDIQSN